MITIHFLQPDSPMPMSGMVCYINVGNFQAKCLMQYWQRGKSLWVYHFYMPEELIRDSLDRVKLGIGFSGSKPLSKLAIQWVTEQHVHIPIFIQIIDAMRETGTTQEELSKATKIRYATISDFFNQKRQMNAAYIDRIFKYLIQK